MQRHRRVGRTTAAHAGLAMALGSLLFDKQLECPMADPFKARTLRPGDAHGFIGATHSPHGRTERQRKMRRRAGRARKSHHGYRAWMRRWNAEATERVLARHRVEGL